MKIYIHTLLKESEKQLLINALPVEKGYQLSFGDTLLPENRRATFLEASVCMGNVPLDWAEESVKLQWLQLHSAGLDPYQQLSHSRFPITHLKGFFGQSVAETAVAGIMAVYRGIDRLSVLQPQNHWVGGSIRPSLHLLFRKKVGILGNGAIGQTVAKILNGFDCDIKIFSRTAIEGQVWSWSDIGAYLPELDILVACLPETTETIGLIDEAFLNLMKKEALFVNVGRGSAVNEPVLIKKLQAGAIAGAVLDVTAVEPLPQNHVLWNMPNVLLTQHSSGGWAEENADKVKVFLNNLKRFENNEPLENIADLAKGY